MTNPTETERHNVANLTELGKNDNLTHRAKPTHITARQTERHNLTKLARNDFDSFTNPIKGETLQIEKPYRNRSTK